MDGNCVIADGAYVAYACDDENFVVEYGESKTISMVLEDVESE